MTPAPQTSPEAATALLWPIIERADLRRASDLLAFVVAPRVAKERKPEAAR